MGLWILREITQEEIKKGIYIYQKEFIIHKDDLLDRLEFIKSKCSLINTLFNYANNPTWNIRGVTTYVNKILFGLFGIKLMTIRTKNKKESSRSDRENYTLWFDDKMINIFKSLE